MLLPEGFQVCALVAFDRDEIVIVIFVIPDEKGFASASGLGNWISATSAMLYTAWCSVT